MDALIDSAQGFLSRVQTVVDATVVPNGTLLTGTATTLNLQSYQLVHFMDIAATESEVDRLLDEVFGSSLFFSLLSKTVWRNVGGQAAPIWNELNPWDYAAGLDRHALYFSSVRNDIYFLNHAYQFIKLS